MGSIKKWLLNIGWARKMSKRDIWGTMDSWNKYTTLYVTVTVDGYHCHNHCHKCQKPKNVYYHKGGQMPNDQ